MGALYLWLGRAGTFWVEEEKVPRGGVCQTVCLRVPDWPAKCFGDQTGGQSFRGLLWSSGPACDPGTGTSLLGEDCVLKKLQGLQEMERVPVVRLDRGDGCLKPCEVPISVCGERLQGL